MDAVTDAEITPYSAAVFSAPVCPARGHRAGRPRRPAPGRPWAALFASQIGFADPAAIQKA